MKPVEMARNNVTILAIIGIFCLGSLFMLANPLSLGTYDPPSSRHGAVTHLVLFQYKDDAAADVIAQTNKQMLALKNTCLDPVTKKPYILSVTGGKDNSIEDRTSGISYAFIVEFDSPEKRNYYVNTDPSHQAFKAAAGGIIEKAIVVDFSDGKF
ncbi:stress responsive A/B barrel domain-containing protein [Coniochaeta sp. 2T2.1]|nr:stress responsive A/B barrel domain-containing protein [Coniochaeta sp. 2T2.1]